MTPEQLIYLSHVRHMDIKGDRCLVRIPDDLLKDEESDGIDSEIIWRQVLADAIDLLSSDKIAFDHLVIGTRRICNAYIHMRKISPSNSLIDLQHDVTAVMYQMVENLRENGVSLRIQWLDPSKTMFYPWVKPRLYPVPSVSHIPSALQTMQGEGDDNNLPSG